MLGGKCFGPQICCIPGVGCLMGTRDSLDCYKEDMMTTPCYKPGIECSGKGKGVVIDGQCASDRVCCSTGMHLTRYWNTVNLGKFHTTAKH